MSGNTGPEVCHWNMDGTKMVHWEMYLIYIIEADTCKP